MCVCVVCQIPSTLAPIDAVERYTQLTVNPLHKTNKPGILSMDILYSKVWKVHFSLYLSVMDFLEL